MRTLPLCLFIAVGALHAQDTRTVTEPKIPPACAAVPAQLTSLGGTIAAGDEHKPDTARIQAALDRCPPGRAVELKAEGSHDAFLSGPLQLRRGVALVVDRGAMLYASRNPRDYDLTPGVCGTITPRGHGCKALINGDHVPGAGVMGEGLIDGRGGAKIMGEEFTWWDLAEKARKGGTQNNPRILILSHCDGFTLYRIHLKDSPNFHVSYSHADGFTAWGVIINSPRNARNTDGIDPSDSTNVTITHCFIHTGDDNVAIKAPAGGETAHMTIAHNHFYTGHGVSIGSETDGGASAIRVRDLSIDGADNGLRIKSNISRGGPVHDVEYEDVCIRATRHPILLDSNYSAAPITRRDKIPAFTDIRLKNVRVLGGGRITVQGFDAAHRSRIQFDGVTLDPPDAVKFDFSHAAVLLGPGPVNFRPSGEDVTVTGTPGPGAAEAICADKFVPFPVPESVKR